MGAPRKCICAALTRFVIDSVQYTTIRPFTKIVGYRSGSTADSGGGGGGGGVQKRDVYEKDDRGKSSEEHIYTSALKTKTRQTIKTK